MSEIKVSVITTAYNHEKYIRQTIESIVAQETDFAFELLINDDCSLDATANIIREYESRYPDIIHPIYQKENQYSKGVNVPKLLLDRARGKYIAFCEGDDYWCDNTKLQRQVDKLEGCREYAACAHQTIELNCFTGAKRSMSLKDEDCVIGFEDVIQGGNKAFQMSSLMLRRELASDAELWEFLSISRVGDYPLSIYLALHGGIYYIDRAMSVYRAFSSADSWTMYIKQHPEAAVKHNQEMIKLLEFTDSKTEHRFASIIDERIRAHRYDLLKNKNSKEIFNNKEYAELFGAESGCMKCLLIAKAYCPKALWTILKRIKNNKCS